MDRRVDVCGLAVSMAVIAACHQETPRVAAHTATATSALSDCATGTVVATLTWKNGSGAVQDWVLTQPLAVSDLAQTTGCQNATVGNLSVWESGAEVTSELEDDQTLSWIAPGTTAANATRLFEVRTGAPSEQGPNGIVVSPAPVDGVVTSPTDTGLITVAAAGFTVTHAMRYSTIDAPADGTISSVTVGSATLQPSFDNEFDRPPYKSWFASGPTATVMEKKLRTIVEESGSFVPISGGTDAPFPATFRYTYLRGGPIVRRDVEIPAVATPAVPFTVMQFSVSLPSSSTSQLDHWLTEDARAPQPLNFPPPSSDPNAPSSFSEVNTEVGSSARWGLVFDATSGLAFGVASATFNALLLIRGGVVTLGDGPINSELAGAPVAFTSYYYLGSAGGATAQGAADVLRSVLDQQIKVSITGLAARLATASATVSAAAPSAARAAAETLLASAAGRQEKGRELLYADELIAASGGPLASCGGDVCSVDTDHFRVAANAEVGLSFKHQDGKVSLDNVVHAGQGYGFFEPALADRPMWQLQLSDAVRPDLPAMTRPPLNIATVGSDGFPATLTWDNDATLTLSWAGDQTTSRPDVTVTVSMRPAGDATGPRLTSWSILATPRWNSNTIWMADFPMLGGLRRNPSVGATKMVVPVKSGALLTNPQSTTQSLYPGVAVAQLLPLWQETAAAKPAGLYLAAHDAKINTKTFRLGADGALTTQLAVSHPVADMGYTWVPFAMEPEYRFAIGAFDGDWFDAAQIYRRWVQGADTGVPVPWLPSSKLASNVDVPDWFKQASVTTRADYYSANILDASGIVIGGHNRIDPAQVAIFSSFLNARGPVLLQLYDWHETPACEHSPLVLPDSAFSCAVTDVWRPQNIHPIVWELFNGFHSQYHQEVAYDDSYAGAPAGYTPVTGLLEPTEVQDELGNETESPTECADQPTRLADAQDPTWQQVQSNVATRIGQSVTQPGPIGIYLDVAATPGALPLCMRGDHGHSIVGGGHGQADANRSLLSLMRNHTRQNLSNSEPLVATVVEGGGEAFIDVTDSHFSFRGDGVWPAYVPMFETIYADYIRPFGSKGIDATGTTAAASAQQFAYGGRIGRVDYGSADTPDPNRPYQAGNAAPAYPSVDYARTLARYRETLLPFLAFGQMARPLPLTYDAASVAGNSSILAQRGSLVVNTAWRTVDPQDQRVAFVFASADSGIQGIQPTAFSFTVNPQDYGIPATYNLVRLTQDVAGGTTQSSFIGDMQTPRAVSVTLQPREVATFVAEPASFNLALNGLAKQSSTSSYNPASLAVDGQSGGRNATIDAAAAGAVNPWWQVDLGESFYVEKVLIWNTTDNFREQQIYLFATQSQLGFPLEQAKSEAGMSGAPPQIPGMLPIGATTLNVNAPARFVRLQHNTTDAFYLAEVQVIGHRLDGVANLALGSTGATESSSRYSFTHADKAVDGNASGDQSQESFIDLGAASPVNYAGNMPRNGWWQADLGAVQSITEVRLWNVTTGSNYRNNYLKVFVSDVPFKYGDFAATRDQPGVIMLGVPTDWSAESSIAVSVGRPGRYVRVAQSTEWDDFYLAEVQVIGSSGTNLPVPSSAVSQSSTRYMSSDATKAVDGRTSGDLADETYIDLGTAAYDNDQGPMPKNPWWQVDLGASHALTDIVLWNVTSGSNYRNNTLEVFVSDTPFLYEEPEATEDLQPAAWHTTIATDWSALASLTIPVNRSGRYVRVQQTNDWDTFYLAEVQVFGDQ